MDPGVCEGSGYGSFSVRSRAVANVVSSVVESLVFVDGTGHRRRVVRWLAAVAGGLLAVATGAGVVGALGGPKAPFLPWPEHNGGRVVRSVAAPLHASAAGDPGASPFRSGRPAVARPSAVGHPVSGAATAVAAAPDSAGASVTGSGSGSGSAGGGPAPGRPAGGAGSASARGRAAAPANAGGKASGKPTGAQRKYQGHHQSGGSGAG